MANKRTIVLGEGTSGYGFIQPTHFFVSIFYVSVNGGKKSTCICCDIRRTEE